MNVFPIFFCTFTAKLRIVEPETEAPMEFQYRLDYSKLSDKQIVERVLAEPHDEEAAAYLLHDRYAPLLKSLYGFFTQDDFWFDDCINELFIHIKGKDGSWHTLASFEWRSTFGYWLKRVAYSKFKKLLPELIENGGRNVSIDKDNPQKPKLQVSDGGESFERVLRKVLYLEAVNKLNDDERFVIMKRMEGYNSREIAMLLDMRWKKYNIVKFNHDGELVVADVAYVDSKAQKARKHLKEIMINNK